MDPPRCFRAIETYLVGAYTRTLRSFLSHEKKQAGIYLVQRTSAVRNIGDDCQQSVVEF